MMMPSTFAPYGASQIIAVTASDQVIALPALPAENPLIALVALQPDMADLYIKLGNSGVSGSSATSMRIKAGSVVTPLFCCVRASETHLSIFCADGPTGSVVLTPGRMLEGVATTVIADNAVTNAKLADMAQSTIKGRAAGAGTGDPTDLTAAQVKTIIAIDHGADLVGLGDDDHTQYVLLAGRAGGAKFTGGAGTGGGNSPQRQRRVPRCTFARAAGEHRAPRPSSRTTMSSSKYPLLVPMAPITPTQRRSCSTLTGRPVTTICRDASAS